MAGFFIGLGTLLSLASWVFFGIAIGTVIKRRRKKITPTKKQRWQWWILMGAAWLMSSGLVALGNGHSRALDSDSNQQETVPAHHSLIGSLIAKFKRGHDEATGQQSPVAPAAVDQEQAAQAQREQAQLARLLLADAQARAHLPKTDPNLAVDLSSAGEVPAYMESQSVDTNSFPLPVTTGETSKFMAADGSAHLYPHYVVDCQSKGTPDHCVAITQEGLERKVMDLGSQAQVINKMTGLFSEDLVDPRVDCHPDTRLCWDTENKAMIGALSPAQANWWTLFHHDLYHGSR